MLYGLWLSAQGSLIEKARHENVTNNLANSETQGFARHRQVFQQRLAEVWEGHPKFRHRSPMMDQLGGGPQLADTYTDFSFDVNAIDFTENDLDFLINGEGFFRVKSHEGETLYSRAGNFARRPDGTLVQIGSAMPLLDEEGKEIKLPNEKVTLTPEGVLLGEQTGEIARIAPVTFTDLQDLDNAGENNYRYTGTDQSVLANSLMRQGYLLGSGVEPVEEMTQVISGYRAYEANMKMMSLQDETVEALINRVSRLG
ncbi:MAG: flagellar hook-basal body protein [Planctomycetes bacterium]|nr:flagellar hook-basal body protein [Planctomycetota bacterium]